MLSMDISSYILNIKQFWLYLVFTHFLYVECVRGSCWWQKYIIDSVKMLEEGFFLGFGRKSGSRIFYVWGEL